MPPACSPTSAGARIRIIAASSRSTSSRNAAFVGIDHPGRAYLALAVFFRHVGLVDDELSPRMRELASTRMLDRARVLGAALRRRLSGLGRDAGRAAAARRWRSSAAGWCCGCRTSSRRSPASGVFNRLRQLARLIGREPVMLMG